ncbi:GL22945 [Drosophila persimilis]|uniref:GL22945 n=1 Tax=Drosophila persimilis TaxID=7234 RepID=B4H9U9_DROPE|nr:GL22945 [Drosophila persimilis]
MTELKNMMAQLVTMQMLNAEATAAAATANQQQKISEEDTQEIFHDSSPGGQATKNVRQASVKETANTLPTK